LTSKKRPKNVKIRQYITTVGEIDTD